MSEENRRAEVQQDTEAQRFAAAQRALAHAIAELSPDPGDEDSVDALLETRLRSAEAEQQFLEKLEARADALSDALRGKTAREPVAEDPPAPDAGPDSAMPHPLAAWQGALRLVERRNRAHSLLERLRTIRTEAEQVQRTQRRHKCPWICLIAVCMAADLFAVLLLFCPADLLPWHIALLARLQHSVLASAVSLLSAFLLLMLLLIHVVTSRHPRLCDLDEEEFYCEQALYEVLGLPASWEMSPEAAEPFGAAAHEAGAPAEAATPPTSGAGTPEAAAPPTSGAGTPGAGTSEAGERTVYGALTRLDAQCEDALQRIQNRTATSQPENTRTLCDRAQLKLLREILAMRQPLYAVQAQAAADRRRLQARRMRREALELAAELLQRAADGCVDAAPSTAPDAAAPSGAPGAAASSATP